MAELPTVPFPTSTTQPIKQNLTAADIASPYTMIAQASEKVSGALSDVAVPLAEQAAAKSVRTDDQGNPVVDSLPPLVGDAAKSARLVIAAKLQPQIETGLLQERLKNPYDPQAFAKAAGAYKTTVMGNISDPTLSVGIDRMIDSATQQNLRSTIVAQRDRDTAEKLQTFQARVKEITEQNGLIARQQGTGSDAYKANSQTLNTLYESQVNDPNQKMSPDRKRVEINAIFDNDTGQAVIGQVQQDYLAHKDDPGAKVQAYKTLYDRFLGSRSGELPKTLSIEKRNHFISEGQSAINNLSVKDADAISAHHKLTTDVVKNVMDTGDLQLPQINNMIQRARDIDDPKDAALLQKLVDDLPLIQSLGKMTGPQAAAFREKLARGVLPTAEGGEESVDWTVDAPTERMYTALMGRAKKDAAQGIEQSLGELEKRVGIPGAKIEPGEIRDAISMAHMGGRPELVRKVQAIGAGLERANRVPVGETKQAIEAVREMQAHGGTPEEIHALDVTHRVLDARDKQFREDPLLGGANAGIIPKPESLDTSNPAAFGGNMGQRGHFADLMREAWRQTGGELGPVATITGANAKVVRQQLIFDDPEMAAQSVLSIGPALHGDDFLATMKQEDMKAALQGMANSKDLPRVTAAMKVYGDLYSKYPQEFGSGGAFADMRDRLVSWQNQEGLPDDRRAMATQPPNDPKLIEAQKDNEKNAKDELKGLFGGEMSPQTAVYKVYPQYLVGLGGPSARVPLSSTEAQVFSNDFSALYTGQRKLGSSPDDAKRAAIAMMRTQWMPSVANQTQLTRDAPEQFPQFFPPMGDPKLPGAYDWTREQRDALLTRVLGPQRGPMTGDLEAGAIGQGGANWTFLRLVSDETTRRQAQNGERPTYQMFYRDSRGQQQLFVDPETHSTRFTFNPGTARTPTAEPTGAFADYETRQKDELARKDALANRMRTAPTGVGIPSFLKLLDAHARYRDGGK